jgi:hypothetical protein
MVVCWDDLPPDEYTHILAGLADWIGWFRATYRIPAGVIPPCWFAHPGLREDIGHLWTGWLLTRHPDAGVGMIGLDWDQRRDAAINRLREATAITGCTATRHQAEPEPVAAIPASAGQLWQDHLHDQTLDQVRAITRQAAVDQVVDILQAAELRHDLAPTILADTADDPAHATDDDRARVAERLRQFAADAVDRAAQAAADAARTVLDAQQHTANEGAVALTRETSPTCSHRPRWPASNLRPRTTSPSGGSMRSKPSFRPRSPPTEPPRRPPPAPPQLISEPRPGVATQTSTASCHSARHGPSGVTQ